MEFIKREEVVELIENYGSDAAKDGVKEIAVADIKILAEAVKLIPAFTINAGQWAEKPSRLGSNYKLFDCSVCGFTLTFKPDYAFCPRCGAVMKGCVEK